MTLDQGIHFDVPSAVYFADPAPQPSLTQSIAKTLIDYSPLHAWHEHPRLGGRPDEPPEQYVSAQAIGNAAHKLMIGRGKEIEVVDLDSWRGKAADQRREIEASGRVAILQKHFVRARNMVEVGRARLADTQAFELGSGEVVLIWREGDIWLRTMIDWLSPQRNVAWDYKTSGLSCAPHAIPALMLNGGWDVQAAMHERGLNALDPDGAGRRKFRFVSQENTEPYAVTVAELPEDVVAMGHRKLAHAIDIWADCIRSGRWPSYPNDVVFPEYPGWAEQKWLNREIHDAARQRHPTDRDARNLMAG